MYVEPSDNGALSSAYFRASCDIVPVQHLYTEPCTHLLHKESYRRRLTLFIHSLNARLRYLAWSASQVPDTLLLESAVTPKAATVSSLLLSWILSNEQLGMKLYQVSLGQMSLYVPLLPAKLGLVPPIRRCHQLCMDRSAADRVG
jgi:hypothetical protein